MAEYGDEQEMELEALKAILMDDFQEVDSDVAALSSAKGQCFRILISPKGDDEDEPTEIPVRLALCFAHTPNYPDELPLLSVKSAQGVKQADVEEIQQKLLEEASNSLGMAMMYTLATTAKEWLRQKYGQADTEEEDEDENKEEVVEAHGLPVNEHTFNEWREQFEAEIALEQAKLMSTSALVASKEKRLTGRQWFVQRATAGVVGEEEVEEDEDGDEDFDLEELDEEDEDEDEMLEHYLGDKNGAE